MQTRRGFLASLAGLAAAAGLSRFAGGAVMPARRGIPGRTYFRVSGKGVRSYMPPSGYHVYLDGRDVHNLASECDLEAGWARMYDWRVDPKGRMHVLSTEQRVHFGKVELRRFIFDRTVPIARRTEAPPLVIRFPPELA